jgi:hypothetical protein
MKILMVDYIGNIDEGEWNLWSRLKMSAFKKFQSNKVMKEGTQKFYHIYQTRRKI